MSDEVAAGWRQIAEEESTFLQLWVTSEELKRVEDALPGAMDDALAASESWPPNPNYWTDEFRFGEWGWARVRAGLALGVQDCDDAVMAVGAIADGLERRGVSASISVTSHRGLVTLPRRAPMLIGYLRVRGKRRHLRPQSYRWDPDADALAAVLDAAETWANDCRGRRLRQMSIGWSGAVPLEDTERVTEQLTQAGLTLRGDLVATGSGEFRTVIAAPVGYVALAAGGDRVAEDWAEVLAGMRSLLAQLGSELVYAHLRRGWDLGGVGTDHARRRDWPGRGSKRSQPSFAGFTYAAFDDLYAVNAFGLQLLGPAYADRLPETGPWHREAISGGSVLLEHEDPAAWFAEPFLPQDLDSRKSGPTPRPYVLIRAREQLADILYTPGVLLRHGFEALDGT